MNSLLHHNFLSPACRFPRAHDQLNPESCGGSCQTSAATIPTTTPSATPLTPFVIAPLDPVDDGLTAVLAADFALERAEEADEATSEAFELAELTFEESDALR